MFTQISDISYQFIINMLPKVLNFWEHIYALISIKVSVRIVFSRLAHLYLVNTVNFGNV